MEEKQSTADMDCVFWIPTIYHKPILPLKKNTVTFIKDVSDNTEKYRIYVEAKIIPIGENPIAKIKITTSYETRKYSYNRADGIPATADNDNPPPRPVNTDKTLTTDLIFVNVSKNGMLHYRYKKQHTEEGKLIDLIMDEAIYHLIKEFFHEHEYHDPSHECILKAYVKPLDENLDIKKEDNEALIHYLKQFKDRLRSLRRKTRTNLDNIIKEIRETETNKDSEPQYALLRNLRGDHARIDKDCANALGESIYYKALLNSWYNRSCAIRRHNISASETDDANEYSKELHRYALNINSAIDGICLIQNRNIALFKFQESSFNGQHMKALKDNIEEVHSIGETIISLQEKVQESLKHSDKLAEKSVELGKTGKKLGKWGVILGIISFLLGILSIGLTVWFYYLGERASTSNNEKFQQLEQKIDTLEDKNTLMIQKIDSLLLSTPPAKTDSLP